MRTLLRSIVFGLVSKLTLSLFDGGHSAQAQGLVPGGSLRGYGAASSSAMGDGGPVIIPYGGRTEGFMPGRMGGGSPLSFRPRPTAAMSPARASFGLSTMSGGMGRGLGARPSMFGSTGSGGLGPGGGSLRLGSGGGGLGVMPPRIGYPFRQPPSLLPTTPAGSGTSM